MQERRRGTIESMTVRVSIPDSGTILYFTVSFLFHLQMLNPTFLLRFHLRLAALPLLLAGPALLLPSCSRPAPLQIGDVEIPFEQVEDAYLSMSEAFVVEGHDTIRRSLLMNGLGARALLHARLPKESAAAQSEAQKYVERLRAGSTFREEMELWAQERALSSEPDLPKQPNPSALGAAVAAAVATLEPGEWAGPLRTSFGWELVSLVERFEGPRNRAQVSLYRIQFPVGTTSDRQQAEADWSTLPLSGNTELIDCLSLEFRHNRVVAEDHK